MIAIGIRTLGIVTLAMFLSAGMSYQASPQEPARVVQVEVDALGPRVQVAASKLAVAMGVPGEATAARIIAVLIGLNRSEITPREAISRLNDLASNDLWLPQLVIALDVAQGVRGDVGMGLAARTSAIVQAVSAGQEGDGFRVVIDFIRETLSEFDAGNIGLSAAVARISLVGGPDERFSLALRDSPTDPDAIVARFDEATDVIQVLAGKDFGSGLTLRDLEAALEGITMLAPSDTIFPEYDQ